MRSAAAEKIRKSPGAEKPDAPARSSHASAAGMDRNCSITATVNILSDAWAFLVIREAFFGARRFEEFRTSLGITRATLTDRLRRLTREDIFREVGYSETSSRVEYKLTRSGIDLYPTFMAMMQFGDRWLDSKSGPLQLVHEDCGCVSKPFVACSCCHEKLICREVTYLDGPGAGLSPSESVRRSRRTSEDYMRGRPSSVSRTLEMIGDRWSVLLLQEAFLGAKRYEQFEAELHIATNILADRLARLVEQGVFKKKRYQTNPERFEYILTAMGTELHGPLMMMMAWGDRWRSAGEAPMLVKHLTCGNVTEPEVVCNRCGKPILAYAMKYRMRYDADQFGGRKNGRAMPGR